VDRWRFDVERLFDRAIRRYSIPPDNWVKGRFDAHGRITTACVTMLADITLIVARIDTISDALATLPNPPAEMF